MRLGVISDVHGNRVALAAVLDDMPAVDGLVCAGDVVGYNPWPVECVAALRDRDVPTVMGNHDRAVATGTSFRFNAMAAAGVEHAREELDDDALAWLADLPDRRTVAGGRVAVAHGHPVDPDRYTYPREFSGELIDRAADRLGDGGDGNSGDGDDDAVAGGVDAADLEALVLGHTHVQGHRTFDEGVVLNPGSVGQPRDGDPRAGYAVLDLPDGDGTPTVEERRVAYDIDAVADAVADAGLPERIASRLYDGE
ncbi:metallophosphatase family protein [Halobaculum sp. CBA1158]|uniref:metallophosphoesterase family protein n=1 Tax=Halobaculum sp. CBA1158 TaxID=2904243 RepID=UPI001F2E568D|nr:metallophosphoesterase family protein [Halobaculum sp. CBA1158]UIO99788.1 metallophosphatase family protein [Halobaculum sp. CBA1158]